MGVCLPRWLFMASLVFGVVPPGSSGEDRGDVANFEVHEWGVFTAPRDALWLKQDMVAEWSSFPDFFHGIWPKENLCYRGPVTKPVIFFHSSEELDVQFQVRFANGRPLVWWPPAEFPNRGGAWIGPIGDNDKIDADSVIVFRLRLNDGLEQQQPVPEGHWLNQLRKVKSAPIRTYGSHNQFSGMSTERESFIYYDGMMKPPNAPVVTRALNGIKLATDSSHDWLDVVVVEREDELLRIAAEPIPKIAAGKRETAIKLVKAERADVGAIKKRLKKTAMDAGLHADEAQSLIDVWGQGLLERQGLTVFYRVDQRTYDSWLPIVSIPKPKKTARVGLVVHYHLEPELESKIDRLIGELDSPEYQTRNRADMQLREIGGPAYQKIQDAATGASLELKSRCQKILQLDQLERKAAELMEKFSPDRNK